MSKNCVDIVQPFAAEIADREDVQLIGGVGSFALRQETAEILPDQRLIIVPGDVDLSEIGQYRPDGNLRDMDVMVKSSDRAVIDLIEQIAKRVVSEQLEISVFGLHSLEETEKQTKHPELSIARRWLADRYVREEDGEITEARKTLFPIEVEMDLGSLETWHTVFGDNEPVPVAHPGVVILNYLTRSISGLRPKDAEKVHQLARNLFEKWPELLEWITDGPGESQLEMAHLLHSLREPDENAQPLLVGGKLTVEARNPLSLFSHPAFMRTGNISADMKRVLKSRGKAQLLHAFEANPRIVTLYQRFAESRMDAITKNS